MCRKLKFNTINMQCSRLLLGKERSRSQGPRGIVGLKRENADDSNYGVVATQTGELGELVYMIKNNTDKNGN